MRVFFLILIATLNFGAFAQHKMSRTEYISKYKNIAIEQMSEYGIPASITLAQGILESGDGGSRLAIKANNHFGIKCGNEWKGERIYHDDDSKGECFRKYKSAVESYVDHSIFLATRSRYASLFKLEQTDYVGWARGLKAAGYATNLKYADLLIKIIEDNNLHQFDLIKTQPKTDDDVFANGEIFDKHGRQFGVNNGVGYVVARTGDSFPGIAYDRNIKLNKLLKYNDLPAVIPLKKGVAVYVGMKKRLSPFGHHVVVAGDTGHSISQRYGVREKSLVKMNPALKFSMPKIGDLVKLR